nr:SPOR domain-containing protein [Sansalvadorimonas sp. 2012CJ34-2]
MLILNGGYYLYLQRAEEPLSAENANSGEQVLEGENGVTTITLLSEAVAAGKAQKIEQPVKVAESEAVKAEPRLCTSIGAFKEESEALQIQQRLMASGIGSEIKPEKVPAASNYWVYIQPLPDRSRATQKYRELKAQGIDSYLMTDGEMKNAISLGLFSKEKLANRLLEKHQSRGDDVALKEVPRFKFEYWVHIKPEDRELFGKELWDGLKESYEFAEKHDNLCEDGIATTR